MSHTTYEVIQHDGGWAYKMGSTISETFATHELAHAAAARAAGEQRRRARTRRSNTRIPPANGAKKRLPAPIGRRPR